MQLRVIQEYDVKKYAGNVQYSCIQTNMDRRHMIWWNKLKYNMTMNMREREYDSTIIVNNNK